MSQTRLVKPLTACVPFAFVFYFIYHIVVVNVKGGPGAAVEPTVCNRKVPGSSPSLCIFVWVKLEA